MRRADTKRAIFPRARTGASGPEPKWPLLPQVMPPPTSPDSPPRIALAEGQILQGHNLALPRAAAIAGRLASNGDPVSGVSVRALSPGDRSEMGGYPAQTSSSPLPDLSPHAWRIPADGEAVPRRRRSGRRTRVSASSTPLPGPSSRDEAARVRVRAGQETAVGDLQLTRARMLRVKGTILDSQGAPPRRRTLVTLARDGGSSGIGLNRSTMRVSPAAAAGSYG